MTLPKHQTASQRRKLADENAQLRTIIENQNKQIDSINDLQKVKNQRYNVLTHVLNNWFIGMLPAFIVKWRCKSLISWINDLQTEDI